VFHFASGLIATGARMRGTGGGAIPRWRRPGGAALRCAGRRAKGLFLLVTPGGWMVALLRGSRARGRVPPGNAFFIDGGGERRSGSLLALPRSSTGSSVWPRASARPSATEAPRAAAGCAPG
jgi:hypothetical protein